MVEKKIDEGELVLLNVIESLDNRYGYNYPNHIKELVRDLKVAIRNDIEIQDDNKK